MTRHSTYLTVELTRHNWTRQLTSLDSYPRVWFEYALLDQVQVFRRDFKFHFGFVICNFHCVLNICFSLNLFSRKCYDVDLLRQMSNKLVIRLWIRDLKRKRITNQSETNKKNFGNPVRIWEKAGLCWWRSTPRKLCGKSSKTTRGIQGKRSKSWIASKRPSKCNWTN